MRPKLNENICCDPFYGDKDLTLPHYNAKTGEKLFDMPGDEPRRISRRKLRNFLSQGVDVHVCALTEMNRLLANVRSSTGRN